MSEKTGLIDVSELTKQYPEFGVYVHEGFTVVRIFAPFNEESFAVLSKRVEDLQNQKLQHVAIDCLDMTSVNPLWARFVVSVNRALLKAKMQIAGLNMGAELKRFLRAQGLDASLPPCDTWAACMAKFGIEKSLQSLDVKLINPFLGAAANMIATAMSTACKTGNISPLKPNAPIEGDVSGLIALDCGSMRAVVVFTFPKETIFKLVARMTGSPPREIDPMVRGSVGEITNIAFTRGKKTLNEMGYGIKSAIPKVVESHELPPEYVQYSGPGVVIPFSTDCGAYYAEIRLAD